MTLQCFNNSSRRRKKTRRKRTLSCKPWLEGCSLSLVQKKPAVCMQNADGIVEDT